MKIPMSCFNFYRNLTRKEEESRLWSNGPLIKGFVLSILEKYATAYSPLTDLNSIFQKRRSAPFRSLGIGEIQRETVKQQQLEDSDYIIHFQLSLKVAHSHASCCALDIIKFITKKDYIGTMGTRTTVMLCSVFTATFNFTQPHTHTYQLYCNNTPRHAMDDNGQLGLVFDWFLLLLLLTQVEREKQVTDRYRNHSITKPLQL